ncbi:MAG: MATE family efflux transporter, partial [Proteobacteria bacterium]|nr:MATE family efflux transporter [Pseudomonadota bacterium]
KVAIEYLHIVPLSIGFMGIMTVATHGFNALRRPMPALGLSVARLLLVYFPLALIGRVLLGYTGVFWATALANLVVGIAAALWLKAVLEQTPSTGFGITSKSETTPNVL